VVLAVTVFLRPSLVRQFIVLAVVGERATAEQTVSADWAVAVMRQVVEQA
jgi:hypothetical protein